jgi:hypothetical protein
VKISNRQQLLAIVAGAAIALWAADRLLITPLTKTFKARTEQITKLQKQVGSGRGLIQRERSLRDRWEQMRANTLPADASMAEQQLLKSFDKWAQTSRLGLASINPQWKHDSDEYMTLECRVEAAGDLNTASRFLYELEKDLIPLRVQSLEISSRAGDNDGRQLTLVLQVSGLVLTPTTARP